MCISAAALAAFLSILGPDNVTMGDDVIIIHATEADAIWTADGDIWCTDAPRQPHKSSLINKS